MENIRKKVEEGSLLALWQELELVNSKDAANTKLLYRYVQQYQLRKRSEIALMKRGDLELTIYYIKRHYYWHKESQLTLVNLPKWQQKSNKRAAARLIEAFHETTCRDVEVAIVNTRNRAMIGSYIKYHGFFYDEAQVALIKTGDDELIEFQIRRHGLREEGQIELIRSSHHTLLLFYMEHDKLCDRAWQYWQIARW